MTTRFSNSSNLRSPGHAKDLTPLKAAVWGRPSRRRRQCDIAPEALETRVMLSSSWYVSPLGSDKDPGTLAQPFQTIQAAADVAQAGDHVEIEAGTYRQDVIPAHSGTPANPIVYEAYDGQSVTISGADVLTGWTNYSGNVYQTSMPEDLGEGNNEVFVNGQEINEARYPNTSLDLSNQTMATMQSVKLGTNSVTIYDSALSQPANYWTGAIIHMTPGQQWEAQTGTVTSSSPGQITVSYTPGNSYELPEAGNPFYLTGTFKALNTAGEWYRDPGSGLLYLWTPAGDSPANDLVEVKARADAFNLDGKSNITIRNVNIFAATISTDSGSTNAVMDGLNVRYTSQFLTLVRGWAVPINAGIMLRGADDLLENSVVADSPGDGVYMSGAGSRVTNSIIHDVDTDGGDAAGIRDMAPNSEIDHDTIYNTGRDGILHESTGIQILYNVVHDFGQLTTDGGGIYTVRTDGGGTTIAYNTVYGAHSGGYGETGLYLDNNSSNYIVHNNNTYDVDTALKMNYSSEHETIYNNTLDATQHAVFGNFAGDWNGTTFTDNVFQAAAQFGGGVVLTGNTTTAAAGKGAGTFVAGASLTPPQTNGGGGSSSSGSGGGSMSTGSGSGSTTGTSGSGGTSTGTGSGSTSSGSGSGSTTGTSGSGGSSTGTGGGSTSSGSGSGSTTGTSGSGGSSTGTGSGSTSSGSGSGSTTGTSGSGSTSTGTGSGSTSSGSGSGSTTGTSGSGGSSAGTGSGSTSSGSGSGSTTGTSGSGGSSTGSGSGSTSNGSGSGSTTGTSGSGGSSTGSGSGSTSSGNGSGSTIGSSGSGSTGSGGGSSSTGTGNSGNTGSGAGNGISSTGAASGSAGSGSGSTSTGTGSTSGSPSSGSGSTSTGTGSGSTSTGTGTSTGSGSGSTTPPEVGSAPGGPAASPGVSQLKTMVKGDRAALKAAREQHRAALRKFASARQANVAMVQAARAGLSEAMNRPRSVGASAGGANRLEKLRARLQQYEAAVKRDTADLKTARSATFALAAQQKLAADLAALHAAIKAAPARAVA